MPSIIQNTKHTNELEAAKNKLLKTKHNIESRRMSSIGHGNIIICKSSQAKLF